ncbi:MAG: hypothetical protein ACKO5R_03060 [Planctomycetaceae bacterium]
MAKRSPGRREPRAAPPRRACGAMAAHMLLLERFPQFRANLMRLERATSKRREARFDLAAAPVVVIDTVVHVVHSRAAENISDAQIESQIAVLNADFRGANPDMKKVPAPWAGLASDARISFRLSKVTRTATKVAGFSTDDGVKSAAGGASRRSTPRPISICGSVRCPAGSSATPSSPAARRPPTGW